jgi:hypothetical protein
MKFAWKVIRNGLLLTGMYFLSIFASNQYLTLQICKPVVIFLGTYILTEFINHYKLASQVPVRNVKAIPTLIF